MPEVIASAKADAEMLARVPGGRLGAIVDVTSSGANIGFQQATQLNFDSRFGFNQSNAPEVTVTATVTLRYRLLR